MVSESFRRIAAIARVDFLVRFRRLSTLVVFLLLCGFAALWIPDPSTGQALLVIDDQRALYNSAAIGMATALIATIFVGLFGFYVISSAIRRDVESRCGFVIASTTMRSFEYLSAKFLGNLLFLTVFSVAFMASSMVMLLVRSEAPLDLPIFVLQYLLLVPGAIVSVSVLALVFESIPVLSGRVGDVLYFILWVALIGLVVATVEGDRPSGLAGYFDVSGLGFTIQQLQRTLQTENVSIGASSFDATRPLFVFEGLELGEGALAPRIGATFIALPLLGIAWATFHRFDPARVRVGAARGSSGWIARLSRVAKPLTRVLFISGGTATSTEPSSPSIGRAAWIDARLTLAAQPLILLGAVGVGVASLSAGAAGANIVWPVAFLLVGVAVADVAARERRAGVLELVYSAPLLQTRFVGWKLLSTSLVALSLMGTPLLHALFASPSALPALVVGLYFTVATATALGVLTGNPRSFIVLFLTFMYVVTNSGKEIEGLDFAGFYGKSTPVVTIAYAAAATAFVFAAHWWHAARLRR